jgi:glycosyltransferase involved in cell wall biosynthesis
MKGLMKVLNVSSTINPVLGGGEAERSFQMSLYLQKAGINCHILTVDSKLSGDRREFLGNENMTILPCLVQRFLIPKPSYAVISRLVQDADIVHLMGHWTVLNALTYIAIRRHGKHYVVCPAGSLRIFGRSKFLKHIYNLVVGNAIIKNATKCIAVTKSEVDSFLAYGTSLDRIEVIPNGVSPNDFNYHNNEKFRQAHNLGDKPFILFMGRLNPIKGPDLLLNAFIEIADKYPEVNLVFAGPDSGLLLNLKKFVNDNELKGRVFFLGYLGGNEKSQAYHAAELLVIPSRHEAMSIVVLEAGICGCPVMFTDKCGLSEVLGAGAGIQTEVSKVSIEKALSRVLGDSNSLDLLASLLKNLVNENYLWSLQAQRFIELAHSVVDGE